MWRLNRATLARQLPLRRERRDVAAAVRSIVGLQAQKPASPSLERRAQRLAEADGEVERLPQRTKRTMWLGVGEAGGTKQHPHTPEDRELDVLGAAYARTALPASNHAD